MRISISYLYERGGAAAGGLASNLLSHHHVIAYPYMYYLGVISLCYLRHLRDEEDASYESSKRKLIEACHAPNLNLEMAVDNIVCTLERGVKRFSLSRGAQIDEALTKIAWMPMNLFTGPCGEIRADDPGQGYDTMPVGMRNNQKEKLRDIRSAMNNYNQSGIPHVQGAGGSTQSIRFDNDAYFNSLAAEFLRCLDAHIGCYDASVSDWLIKSNNKYYKIVVYEGQPEHALTAGNRRGRELISGEFVVKKDQNVRGEFFKLLQIQRDRGEVYGILVNDAENEYERQANERIKDKLARF